MNPKHQIFLSEVLCHGDASRANKTAYPEAEGEALRTAANRLLHQPAIVKVIEDFHGSIRDCLVDDIVAHRVNQVQAIRLKRSVLRSIYTKEAETNKTISSKVFEIREITIEPTIAEILRAVQMDNALAEKEEELLHYEAPSIIRFGDSQEEQERTSEIVTNRNPALGGAGKPSHNPMIAIDVDEDTDGLEMFYTPSTLENTDNQFNPEDPGSETVNSVTERNNFDDLTLSDDPDIGNTSRGNLQNLKNPGSEIPEEELMAV